MPPSKWAATMAGLSSSVTVHIPNRDWNNARPAKM